MLFCLGSPQRDFPPGEPRRVDHRWSKLSWPRALSWLNALLRRAAQRGKSTNAGRANVIDDVGAVLVAKVVQGRHHRIRSSLPKPAKASLAHVVTELLEPSEVVERRRARGDTFEDARRLNRPGSARHALATRLADTKIHVESRHVDHAGGIVHHDQPAGSHDRADGGQRLVIERHVQELRWNTTPGRTTGLNRFEGVSIRNSAANVEEDLA